MKKITTIVFLSLLVFGLVMAGSFNSALRTEGAVTMITYTGLLNHGGGIRKINGIVYNTPAYYAHQAMYPLLGAHPVSFKATVPFSDVPEWQSWGQSAAFRPVWAANRLRQPSQ